MNDYFNSIEFSIWDYYVYTYFLPDGVWDSLINLRDEENQ